MAGLHLLGEMVIHSSFVSWICRGALGGKNMTRQEKQEASLWFLLIHNYSRLGYALKEGLVLSTQGQVDKIEGILEAMFILDMIHIEEKTSILKLINDF